MKKLIYLEDATNEIARWIGYLDKDMISRIQIGLERLPSAQPTKPNTPNTLEALDCISRQKAVDAFNCTDELIVGGSANAQNVMNYINKVIGKIKALPSAQPEIEERMSETEHFVPNDDFISRKGAIDLIEDIETKRIKGEIGLMYAPAIKGLKALSSAQPDIIRCEDCKWYGRADKRRFYRGMDCLQKRIDTIVPDKDFCSKAERRTDE